MTETTQKSSALKKLLAHVTIESLTDKKDLVLLLRDRLSERAKVLGGIKFGASSGVTTIDLRGGWIFRFRLPGTSVFFMVVSDADLEGKKIRVTRKVKKKKAPAGKAKG